MTPTKKATRWYERMSLNHAMGVYSKFACRRPFLSLTITLLVSLGLTIAMIGSGLMAFDENNGREWDIRGVTETSHSDAVDAAIELQKDSLVNRDGAPGVLPRSETNYGATLNFLFESKTGNMLTPENLELVRQIEMTVLSNVYYGGGAVGSRNYCELEYDTTDGFQVLGCRRPNSVLDSFFGPESTDPANKYAKPGYKSTIQNFDATLAQLKVAAANGGKAAKFFSKEFVTTGKSKYIRSTIYLGKPLELRPIDKPARDADQRERDENEEIYSNLLKGVSERIFTLTGAKKAFLKSKFESKKNSIGDVKVGFYAPKYYGEEFGRAAMGDFSWVIFSIILVYAYMFWHTRSLLLCGISLANNFFSFPLAFFIFRVIFQIKYFASIHLLMMFIVLGIGADDIFVFADAFAQSGTVAEVCGSLESRIEFTTRRASKAIFLTSFTTCVSFFATAISAIMPIQSFGAFAGLVIVLLYVLTVLNLPPILTIYGRYYEDLEWYQCSQCCADPQKLEEKRHARTAGRMLLREKSSKNPNAAKGQKLEGAHCHQIQIAAGTGNMVHLNPPSPAESASNFGREKSMNISKVSEPKLRPVEAFFHETFYETLNKFKWVFVALGVALFAIGIAFTVTIRPPSKSDEWLPNTHMLQWMPDKLKSDLWLSTNEDDYNDVSLTWGVKGMDISDINKWDTSDRGEIEFQTDFDPLTPAAQTFLLSVCPALRASTCEAKGCNGVGSLVAYNQTKCFIEDMKLWLELTYPSDPSMRLGSMPPAVYKARLLEYSETARYLNGYPDQIGFVFEKNAEPQIKYIMLKVKSSYKSPASVDNGRSAIRAWNQFLINLLATAPAGMKLAFPTAGGSWVFVPTQENLISSALQGIGIVFAFAIVVITLSTFNLVIALVATFCIAGIVVSTVGIAIVKIMGWDLGVAESVAVVILIGFSMDYVLHVAEAYVDSGRKIRTHRTQDALTHLGISVLAGCLTNLLSASVLWGATFTFFKKFAWLIQSVTFFAFLWAVVFFPALMLVLGPQGKFGNLTHMFNTLRGKKSQDDSTESEASIEALEERRGVVAA